MDARTFVKFFHQSDEGATPSAGEPEDKDTGMNAYRVSDQVEWRAVDDEVIILDLRTQLYLNLNDSGAVLWKGVNDEAGFGELVSRLRARFDVDVDQASADVRSFLDDLVEHGLVTVDGLAEHPAG